MSDDNHGLPTTDDGTPVVHAHVTESRSGADLELGREFIVLFHDRAVHAKVTKIHTDGDADGD